MDFYTRHIKSNPEWEFVGVYTDEGISGTNTRKREGFNHMVADALAGKIDLILTKSISRFARNTVDTLTTVRKLKEKKVEVYFEKENIYTLDAKGEVMITIMSSLAQEESRSISEMLPGENAAAWKKANFPLHTKIFLAMRRARMACLKSWRKKQKLSVKFTDYFWKEKLSVRLQITLPGREFPHHQEKLNGAFLPL